MVPKVDLFYKEIQVVMRMYPSMSWWDAYALAIPTRKWLIEEYNRQIEEENSKAKNTNKPLPPMPILGQQVNQQSKDFMTGVRNK